MRLVFFIALFALMVGFLSGYQWRDSSANDEKMLAVNFAIKKMEAEAVISRAEDLALIISQQKTKGVYKTIIKKVPEYVSDKQENDSDCNLSTGIVGLYNSAALEQLPDPSSIDDAGSTRPSSVTELNLINYGIDVVHKYNSMKNQCNALINWFDKTRS